MPIFEVPGAKLYYETFGEGPLLLMIPGADGRGSVFHDAAKSISSRFTIACWDRRGYSRSSLVGEQDFANRMNTDADDAQKLIAHLSDSPATVFGTSSGALVAQALLARHPQSVKLLVAHEPPCFSVLPEEFQSQAAGLVDHVYDTYRAHGTATAMEVFTSGLSEGGDGAMMRNCMDGSRSDEIRANSLFWFEFELRQYTKAPLDVDDLRAAADKYMPAAGIDSGDGPGVGPVSIIAAMLGRDMVRLPGGHVGFMTTPVEFSRRLIEILDQVE